MKPVQLASVYSEPHDWVPLWELLSERDRRQNISHRAMPLFFEHEAFVKSRPYLAWYYIWVERQITGAIYLTKNREVGLGILKAYQGKGYGTKALAELVRLHPGRMLANINPENAASIAFFHSQGFKPLQVTYAR